MTTRILIEKKVKQLKANLESLIEQIRIDDWYETESLPESHEAAQSVRYMDTLVDDILTLINESVGVSWNE